jgi:antitoxin component YwqK of YwqJK toxin-antitoxin module
MQKVLDSSLDYDEEAGVYTRANSPFTGVAYQLAPGGWTRSEQEFRDGLPWGPSRTWHSPDQLASESHSVGGVWHGVRREWHPNGVLALEEEFELGVALNRLRWDESGSPIEEFQLQESDPDYQTLLMLRKHNAAHNWTGK